MHIPSSRASFAVGSFFALATAACGGNANGQSEPTSNESASVTACDGARCPVIPQLSARPTASESTVPSNGDVNPYGVAFVPAGFAAGGLLRAGDVIVSNFNNSANLQGTGTTIVRVNAGASPSLFFADANAPGFSTALGVLQAGFVLVGNVPSTDGSGACTGQQSNIGQGAVLVIDRHGRLASTLSSPSLLDGPWDMAVDDQGSSAHVFVSNVLKGTVTRVDLRIEGDGAEARVGVASEVQIASGYAHRCDPAALVVGPTGLALDRQHDVLFVAATGDNAIFEIAHATETTRDAGMGRVAVRDATHLHGPVGLVRAENGDLISSQGDAVNADSNHPSEIVEFTRQGRFVAQFSIDSSPGSAFGMALVQTNDGLRFAAVDDGLNVLDVWNVK
jgi:hypothetical protein